MTKVITDAEQNSNGKQKLHTWARESDIFTSDIFTGDLNDQVKRAMQTNI